ncbi:hypothetical protein CQ12_21485 [Bradyrhizobium jicamae]|uniref:Uncharacterized protein n=1 Tax=Bradyrhizobium jicamae TaxID=280332 RepID=A0A0R3LT59_9BRAD|nr:hypothetical protein CQ12_21485 [Bradyrhizobium jicamae]
MESDMSKQRDKSKGGRPSVLGKDAAYLTVKLRRDQIRSINRIAGPAPGGRPGVIRDLLDAGLKLARSRATR